MEVELKYFENKYTSLFIPSFDYHKDLLKQDFEIFEYISKYQDLLKNKNIVDIGSCFGMYSKYFSKITKQKVYCFEPNIANYDILKINLKKLDNIVLSKKAVGNKKDKTFLIYINDTNLGQSVFYNKYFFKENTNQDIDTIKIKNGVDVITLDSLNLKNVGLIKIDVEGFEIDVLKGSIKLINDLKPIIYIGTHKINKIDTKQEVFEILQNSGYVCVKKFDKGNEYIFEYKNNE